MSAPQPSPVDRLARLVLDASPEVAARTWAEGLDLCEARAVAQRWGLARARYLVADIAETRKRDQAEQAEEGRRRFKLGPAEVRAIRAALRRGESQREVARRFGVSQQTVAAISTGQRWGWVK
jgi:hypothetical protein